MKGWRRLDFSLWSRAVRFHLSFVDQPWVFRL